MGHGLLIAAASPVGETGSRRVHSVAVAHRLSGVARGLSCFAACGIFSRQGLNLYLLFWQADSQPLDHQGSPML